MKRAVFCLCAPHSPPPSASTSTNRFARRPSLRLLLFVQPTVICINQRQPSRASSSAPTTISVQAIAIRINQRQPSRPPSSTSTTVVRSGHRRPHQSAPTESRVVIHSDNHRPFRPSPYDSLVVIYFDNHRSFKPSSPASISVNRVAHCHLHQPAPYDSPVVIYFDNHRSFRHRRLHRPTPTESRAVSCSGRRHLLRSTPSLRLPPCASSNIIRFTRRPSRRLPAAPLRYFFPHGRRRGDCLGKGRLRRGRRMRCSFFAGFCAFFAKTRRKSRF